VKRKIANNKRRRPQRMLFLVWKKRPKVLLQKRQQAIYGAGFIPR